MIRYGMDLRVYAVETTIQCGYPEYDTDADTPTGKQIMQPGKVTCRAEVVLCKACASKIHKASKAYTENHPDGTHLYLTTRAYHDGQQVFTSTKCSLCGDTE